MVRREREISEEVQHRSYPDKPTAYNSPPTVPPKKENMMGRLRPQIALGILCATIFSCLGLWIGLQLEAIEVITAIIGGLFGFLGGVSLKVLENE
jgi:hypothetical protein